MGNIRKIKQSITAGTIYLHSMPGKKEPLKTIKDELSRKNVKAIICLTSKSEIKTKSPDYLKSVEEGKLGNIDIIYNPIEDFQIPTDIQSLARYDSALKSAFQELRNDSILIHCAGGVGRTGTFAIILLRLLGLSYEEALTITKEAGSGTENPDQLGFCKTYSLQNK